MKYKRVENGYFVKLEKGDEIIETLTKLCRDNYIRSGSILGIGGTDNISIKYYDLEKKEYIPKNFSGKNYEIISLNGNISSMEGIPILHIHVVIGDSDYRTYGGHLSTAVIDITSEIIINTKDNILNRKPDSEFGLNLWDL